MRFVCEIGATDGHVDKVRADTTMARILTSSIPTFTLENDLF